jgi:hypothetical protein
MSLQQARTPYYAPGPQGGTITLYLTQGEWLVHPMRAQLTLQPPATPAPQPAVESEVTAYRHAVVTIIESHRDRIINRQIAYEGVSLDADARSQKFIADKLAEIAAREATGADMPPELLVWRDADNQLHTFSDMPAYRQWLQGLAIAIAQRGTQAMAWSWAKKAEAESYESVANLRTMDLSPPAL